MGRPKLLLFNSFETVSQWVRSLRNALLEFSACDEDIEHVRAEDKELWQAIAMVLLGLGEVRARDVNEIVRDHRAPKRLRLRIINEEFYLGSLQKITKEQRHLLVQDPDADIRVAALARIDDESWLMRFVIAQTCWNTETRLAFERLKMLGATGRLMGIALSANDLIARGEALRCLDRQYVLGCAQSSSNGSLAEWIRVLSKFKTPSLVNHQDLSGIADHPGSEAIGSAATALIREMETSPLWREEYRSRPF